MSTKSRYKHGKIEKAINLDILSKLMERVKNVDRGSHSVRFIQALIALFYWTGLRRSEVLGDTGHKWKLKSGEIRRSKPFLGLLKENLWVDDEFLFVSQVARKHGSREEPMALPLVLPYVDLIVEQWKETQPKHKIFPISYVSFWRILKRIDPKLYPHFFVMNRMTKLAENKERSIQDICRWSGKSPQTVSYYLAKVGRYSRRTGRGLLKER